ncbi:hypothetical protein [Rouxiella sp. WC2420]|uniref:Uncharacterized protein n=1 Tax=Rouxiella sp. WC2420 TaxID=3234145 RepID=A0AB39VRW5_9GAMM
MKRKLMLIIFSLSISIHQANAALEIAAGMTVGQIINGVKDVVRQVEQSASSLLEQGNNGLAQQQMILAGILKGTVDQMEKAYQGSMEKTFDQLNTTQANTFKDLERLSNGVIKDMGNNVQSAIYQAQGSANQLLNKLPFTDHYPVFYGALSQDLLSELISKPYDIEVLGFMFRDPNIKFKDPIIRIDGNELQSEDLSIQEDRLQITLPEEIKKKLSFSATPCSPRKPYVVSMDVFYGEKSGFWPFNKYIEKKVTFNSRSLVAAEQLEFYVSKDVVTNVENNKSIHLVVPGNYYEVGCEESKSGQIFYNLPENARNVNCSGRWMSVSNLNSQGVDGCKVSGQTAMVGGIIRGKDKEWGNCPGGGHATFQMEVDYILSDDRQEMLMAVPVGNYVMKNNSLDTIITNSANSKTKTLRVSVKRKGCSSEIDSFTIDIPDNEQQVITQTSQNGMFQAEFRKGQLVVKNNN